MRNIRIGNAVLRVMYAGVSPFVDHFKTQIYYDSMGIGEIAGILDRNTGIIYDDDGNQQTFEGYSKLTKIERVDEETVVAILEQEERKDEQ